MTATEPTTNLVSPTVAPVQWAVVCTGFVSADYEVTRIEDAKGNQCPVIVRLFPARDKANTMLKRLQARAAKVSTFGNPAWHATLPIYGIVATDLPAGKGPGRKPAAEGKNGTGDEKPAGRSRPRK